MSAEQKLDVYFYEAFEEETEALRRHLPKDWRVGFTGKTIQEAGDTEPPARLISIRTQSTIPSEWMTKLSGVLSRTTGYDTVRGLKAPCGYLPSYCSRAVAEQAMLLWMALLRKLPLQMQHFTNFNRDALTGLECAGKKLLVVGVGNVGSEIVKIGLALGMTVRGVDILQRHPFVTYVSAQEGLPWAEIIVCAMNLTPANVGYFNYALLKRAHPGVFFVNVARGEHAPTADLVRLLDEGHLAGAALDVYENEGALATALRAGKRKFPLLGRSNVILTPHNAFNTREAVERKAEQSTQQIEQFLKHGEFIWPVPVGK
ncbi:MAG TPA: NAD(P)-dependent oxidoreductase [Verrucomicrobiae bacterium]|nr:NAD(P)-dependent oxidoreductase [Verrucomicrobiae bacterium]